MRIVYFGFHPYSAFRNLNGRTPCLTHSPRINSEGTQRLLVRVILFYRGADPSLRLRAAALTCCSLCEASDPCQAGGAPEIYHRVQSGHAGDQGMAVEGIRTEAEIF